MPLASNAGRSSSQAEATAWVRSTSCRTTDRPGAALSVSASSERDSRSRRSASSRSEAKTSGLGAITPSRSASR